MKKKLLGFVLALCLIIPSVFLLSACGGSGGNDDKGSAELAFSYESSSNTYVVSGCEKDATEIVIPSQYKGDNGKLNVSAIGQEAFKDCDNLNSIQIPNSVSTIRNAAFSGCNNLSKVNYLGTIDQWAEIDFEDIDSNPIVYARKLYIKDELVTHVNLSNATKVNSYSFIFNQDIINITISNSVTSIGAYAFFDCTGLTSITIGNNVTNINEWAFGDCYKLIEIYNLSSLNIVAGSLDNGFVGLYAKDIYTSLDEVSKILENNGYLIYDKTTLLGYVGPDIDLIFPNNIETIYQYAFYNCQDIKNIAISSDVSNIGSHAFSYCTGLTKVSIPESLIQVGLNAFTGCCNLSKVNYWGTIDQWVEIDFENSNSNPTAYSMKLYIKKELVTDIHLSTATKVNSYAFINNQEIRSVEIENGIKIDIKDSMFSGCSKLYQVILGDGVTEIGSKVFEDCIELTSIILGDNITTIQSSAFKGCTSLKSIIIPDSVTSIGSYAFQDCSELFSVKFGNGITSIGNSAFKGCTSLKSIIIPDSVTKLQYSVFKDCVNLNSIIIGSGITDLYGSAFSNCTNLRVVYYRGSVNDWNKIKKITMDNLKNASILYYSETEPTDTTNFYWHYHTDGETPIVWKNFD